MGREVGLRAWSGARRVDPIETCLELQHGPEEQSYAIGDALRRAGADIRPCRIYAGEAVPPTAKGLAGLLVMGGLMSAASDNGFPSRRAEIDLIADAIERGVPTLGVCLGAQLLAVAGGAAVYPGPDGPEIGWAPVRLTAAAAGDALFSCLPPVFDALHWHGDTFDLPPAAVPLVTGNRYRHQAFRIGARAWAVQFHLEVDAGALDTFIQAFADEATIGNGGPEGLRSPAALAALEAARSDLLGRFAALVTGSAG